MYSKLKEMFVHQFNIGSTDYRTGKVFYLWLRKRLKVNSEGNEHRSLTADGWEKIGLGRPINFFRMIKQTERKAGYIILNKQKWVKHVVNQRLYTPHLLIGKIRVSADRSEVRRHSSDVVGVKFTRFRCHRRNLKSREAHYTIRKIYRLLMSFRYKPDEQNEETKKIEMTSQMKRQQMDNNFFSLIKVTFLVLAPVPYPPS